MSNGDAGSVEANQRVVQSVRAEQPDGIELLLFDTMVSRISAKGQKADEGDPDAMSLPLLELALLAQTMRTRGGVVFTGPGSENRVATNRRVERQGVATKSDASALDKVSRSSLSRTGQKKQLDCTLDDGLEHILDALTEALLDIDTGIQVIYGRMVEQQTSYTGLTSFEQSYVRAFTYQSDSDSFTYYHVAEREAELPDDYQRAERIIEESTRQEMGVQHVTEIHPEEKEHYENYKVFGFNQVLIKFKRLLASYNQIRSEELGIHPHQTPVYLM